MKGKVHQDYLVYGKSLKDKVELKEYKKYKIHVKRVKNQRIKKCRGFKRVIFRSLLLSYPSVICNEVRISEDKRYKLSEKILYLSEKYNSMEFEGSYLLYDECDKLMNIFYEVRKIYRDYIFPYILNLIFKNKIKVNLIKLDFRTYRIETYNKSGYPININFNKNNGEYEIKKSNMNHHIINLDNIIYSNYRELIGSLVFNYNPID